MAYAIVLGCVAAVTVLVALMDRWLGSDNTPAQNPSRHSAVVADHE